jgi:hypothetical protein
MAGYVNVKKESSYYKIRLNENTVNVLSRVFKLKPETIYLIGDDAVLMPDASTSQFSQDDIFPFVTYEVFGDPQIHESSETVPPLALGNPYSYQQGQHTGRRNLIPLPACGSTTGGTNLQNPPLSRPEFVFGKRHGPTQGTVPSLRNQTQKWRKTIAFCDVEDGKPTPIYQVYLSLDDTASVENVTEKVELEVETPVLNSYR